jgi:hypothetical protein
MCLKCFGLFFFFFTKDNLLHQVIQNNISICKSFEVMKISG